MSVPFGSIVGVVVRGTDLSSIMTSRTLSSSSNLLS